MIRRVLMTAWLALLVPLLGVGLALAVGMSDSRFKASDPEVVVGFLGGASVGVALWTLGMQALMRRSSSEPRYIWHFIASWPVGAAAWFLIRLPGGSGGSAAPTVVLTLLGWWFVVWSRAIETSSAD